MTAEESVSFDEARQRYRERSEAFRKEVYRWFQDCFVPRNDAKRQLKTDNCKLQTERK